MQVIRRQGTGFAYLIDGQGKEQLIGAIPDERARAIAEFCGFDYIHIRAGQLSSGFDFDARHARMDEHLESTSMKPPKRRRAR